jgi:hypothetical protein
LRAALGPQPPLGETPGIGSQDWGLTAAPVTYDPPRASADEVRDADPSSLRIPALAGLPVAVVTGETSVFAAFAPAIVDFLATAGVAAEQLHLPDYGVLGNGHGLIYETNSDQALEPVLRWLRRVDARLCRLDEIEPVLRDRPTPTRPAGA